MLLGLRPETLVISPYPAFVDYLKKKKIVNEGVEVKAWADSKNVVNRVVVCADLSLRLALLARSVIMVPLELTADDELHPETVTGAKVEKVVGKPRRYKITEVS